MVCSDAKERVGVRKATEATLTYSIPGKTAALLPEFAVEDMDGSPGDVTEEPLT